MGIDIHVHDTFFTFGHFPLSIAVVVVAVLVVVWGIVKVVSALGIFR